MIILILLYLGFTTTYETSFPTNTCWPLCGRVPIGTTTCDMSRCGSCTYNDLPIDNSYGPRTEGSSGNRYDWHRGIDIKTDINSSLFAVTAGEVEDIKPSSSDGISIQLQHFRSGAGNCSRGCYFSRYLHANAVVVNIGDWVETGQLIGYSGASSSGNAHLHFEIRSSKPDDPKSDWQRECVSPLRLLSYCPENTKAQIELRRWNKVSVTSTRKDIVRVELELKNMNGDVIAPTIPDQYGYDVGPTFLDIETLNYQYTHKDSSSADWESFGLNGTHQCPYYAEHGSSYDAALHLDKQSVNNKSIADFNGLMIFPYDEKDDFWGITVLFTGIDTYVKTEVECTVVNVYSAEFGTLEKTIINSTLFGNCDSGIRIVSTQISTTKITDAGPDGAVRIFKLENQIYWILFVICATNWTWM